MLLPASHPRGRYSHRVRQGNLEEEAGRVNPRRSAERLSPTGFYPASPCTPATGNAASVAADRGSAVRRLGDLLHRVADLPVADVVRGEVRLRDHTDETLVLDDRYTTDLLRFHQVHNVLDVGIRFHGAYAAAHVIAHRALVRVVVRDVTDRDVAVRD